MLNNWTGAGRLTRDPELRQTQGGKPVANFSLAIDRDFKTADGERETDFIDVVAWNATAGFVSKFFAKGSMAIVAGRLQQRSWKDDAGQTHNKVEVVANSVYFGGSKGEGNNASGNAPGKSAPAVPQLPVYAPVDDSESEEDLPF